MLLGLRDIEVQGFGFGGVGLGLGFRVGYHFDMGSERECSYELFRPLHLLRGFCGRLRLLGCLLWFKRVGFLFEA